MCAALLSPYGHADNLAIEMSANILNGTCSLDVTSNGIIDLGTVGIDYFRNAVSADSYQGGGAPFSIRIRDCNAGSDSSIKNLHIIFTPKTGSFAPGTAQVFPNEASVASGGAQNVGVVIFSVNGDGSVSNVRNAGGSPNADYSINYLTLDNSVYHFYSRFQKTGISPVVPGRVNSMVLVDVYYD